jgi:hypothetical protein
MKKHPSALSQRSETARERAVELKAAFDWTLQAIALLRRLDGVLSTIVKAWKSFSEEEIGYFHGTEVAPVSLHARRSLHAVRATFRELQGHQEKLVKMNHTCSDYSRNVSCAS